MEMAGVAVLTSKGVITKESEIKQDPIMELKAIEVKHTNNYNVNATS